MYYVKRSKILRRLLELVHYGAIICVWFAALAWFVALFFSLLILWLLCINLKSTQNITAFGPINRRDWLIQFSDGTCLSVKLLATSVITHHVIILNFASVRPILLLRDSLSREQFRELQVYVRCIAKCSGH